MLILLGAFVFGLAEATLFFIVPDVFLTFLVLFNPGLAYIGCFFTLLGALIGGTCMYIWGKRDFRAAEHLVAALPGISHKLIAQEKRGLKTKGLWAIFLGPLKGIPYKIYAICAPGARIALPTFLLISVPARVTRFILTTWVTDLIAHQLIVASSLTMRLCILAAFWLIFYTVYFLKMRNFSR